MSANPRSQIVTQGAQRSPNRAMLRAVGFTDTDFDKPIVGVANSYSTITPCNSGLNVLATRAEAAIKSAGAMPQVFGVITVSDGIAMGTGRHEVLARLARGNRRFDRDRLQRSIDGRRAGDRRLRQEHAGRHDRARADEYSRNLRLRRHDQARPVRRSRFDDRERVRGGRASSARTRSTRPNCSRSSAAPVPAPVRAAGCTPRTRCPRRSKRWA